MKLKNHPNARTFTSFLSVSNSELDSSAIAASVLAPSSKFWIKMFLKLERSSALKPARWISDKVVELDLNDIRPMR